MVNTAPQKKTTVVLKFKFIYNISSKSKIVNKIKESD